MKKKAFVSLMVIFSVLVIDQLIKVGVKTGMYLGERIHITDWFQLVFVENPGMAFGWEIEGGKLFLTLFRIVAVAVIAWYICRLVKSGSPLGYIVCLSLVLAGAAGNIVDCLFYGMIFNNPPYPEVAQFVPWGTGYGELLYGRVVDMFYFPLIEWDMPDWGWLPYGGEHCVFFSPIFNFADASISCGIVALMIFYHKLVSKISF
ncbi:MAG: lipoprotein signal peptidase [Bacteroides sp.]|nr:lipoprotein signal peptidase [Roseburia sp.]MCM1346579.1 lipoprotein signal peptidase [Bacteroides sp.]MCM1421407.1 lipoprotein signal peptidase [Bacteroides sp.]